jgi:hypothetical protein
LCRLSQYIRWHKAKLALVPKIDEVAIAQTVLFHEFGKAATCKLLGYFCTSSHYGFKALCNDVLVFFADVYAG